MVRDDGSRVTTPRHPSWKAELKALWTALRTDPFIILLFPMFFASNYFYTWQFSDYNAVLFNIQGRALNNTVYWVAQIVGSVSIGLLLDQKQYRRRVRAFLAWTILLCMVMGAHIWAWYYQKYVPSLIPFVLCFWTILIGGLGVIREKAYLQNRRSWGSGMMGISLVCFFIFSLGCWTRCGKRLRIG